MIHAPRCGARQWVGVGATQAVKLNVPIELVCEPVHVCTEAGLNPVLCPYTFVNENGVPVVGVTVPMNFTST